MIDFSIIYVTLPTQNYIIWCPGMRLNNQISLRCVCEQLGQILMILPLRLALELALHRNDLLFYFEYIS